MKRTSFLTGMTFSLALSLAAPAHAQLDLFSKEQRVEFTPQWHGDRFPDGTAEFAGFGAGATEECYR